MMNTRPDDVCLIRLEDFQPPLVLDDGFDELDLAFCECGVYL
jgi:hypothetical protein